MVVDHSSYIVTIYKTSKLYEEKRKKKKRKQRKQKKSKKRLLMIAKRHQS